MSELNKSPDQPAQSPKESLMDLIRQNLVDRGVIKADILEERLPAQDDTNTNVGRLTGQTHTGVVTRSASSYRRPPRGTISRF